MPPKRSTKSASRRSTPVSPPKPTNPSATPRQTRSSARSRSKSLEFASSPNRIKSLTAANLPRVEEEETTPPPLVQIDDDVTSPESPSLSNSSYTEHDQTELEALDRDAIIENLPDLAQDAAAILAIFTGTNPKSLKQTYDELVAVSSKLNRRCHTLHARLNISLQPFQTSKFIKIELISRRVANVDWNAPLSTGPWRPDALLQLANLAKTVATLTVEPKELDNLLDLLSNVFPLPFLTLSSGINETPNYVSLFTISLHMDLITQKFIRWLESSAQASGIDPDVALDQLFLDEDRRAHLESLLRKEDHDELDGIILDRVQQIRQYFSTDGHDPVDVNALRAEFPYNDFIVNLLTWIVDRRNELQRVITSRGGVNRMVDLMVAKDFTPTAAIDDTVQEEEDTISIRAGPSVQVTDQPTVTSSAKRPRGRPRKSGSLAKNIDRLKEIEAQKAALTSTTPVTSSSVPTSYQPEENQPLDDDQPVIDIEDEDRGESSSAPALSQGRSQRTSTRGEYNGPVPTKQTAKLLQKLAYQKIQSNKENIETGETKKKSFLDRQPGATRISFSDDGDGRRSSPPKRTRQAQRSDSEESDFETDTRSPKRIRNDQGKQREVERTAMPEDDDLIADDSGVAQDEEDRNQLAVDQQLKSSLTNERREERRAGIGLAGSTVQARQTQRSRNVSEPAARPRSPSQEPPPSSRYDIVNSQAKINVRKAISGDVYHEQNRRAWTPDETERLIDLIAIYRTAWTMILKADAEHEDGPELQNRTDVQLKDKARNIKMDYLKGRIPLPEGFGSVSIGPRLKNKLTELGIQYDGER